MTGSSVAGIITAFSTVLIATGGIIAALTIFLPVLRVARQNTKQIAEVSTQVADVHTIVNQRYTDILNFNRALVRALNDAGITVPIDQSIEDPKEQA